MSAPCNCCTLPNCVPPSIECKSISATGSKATLCGFSYDGKRWLTRTVTRSYSHTDSYPAGTSPWPYELASSTFTWGYSATIVDNYSPGCATMTTTCGGSSSTSGVASDPNHPNLDYDWSCSSTLNSDCTWTGTYTDNLDGANSHPNNGNCIGFTPAGTTTYSNENIAETTGAMIARVVGLLPAWAETWTGTCSAYRNLSPDESSYSLRRFKWRLAHQPSGTCYLKVWLREVFTPEGGGDPIYTDLPPYTWSATGSPCLTDPEKAAFDADNLIYGEPSEIQEPSEDGTTTVEIVKYSCLSGYTPEDATGNGYPPLPEPEA